MPANYKTRLCTCAFVVAACCCRLHALVCLPTTRPAFVLARFCTSAFVLARFVACAFLLLLLVAMPLPVYREHKPCLCTCAFLLLLPCPCMYRAQDPPLYLRVLLLFLLHGPVCRARTCAFLLLLLLLFCCSCLHGCRAQAPPLYLRVFVVCRNGPLCRAQGPLFVLARCSCLLSATFCVCRVRLNTPPSPCPRGL